MGLFSRTGSSVDLHPRFAPALVSRAHKFVAPPTKFQQAVLAVLDPSEEIRVVGPQRGGGVVVVTTQHVFAGGKRIDYASPRDRIESASVMYREVNFKPYVEFWVDIDWTGGPLKHAHNNFYNTIGHFSIDCVDDEAAKSVASAVRAALLV